MRNSKEIDLIFKHHRDSGAIFSGVKHLMVWGNQGTGFQAIEDMPEKLYQSKLRFSLRREEFDSNDKKLKPIINKYGLTALSGTQQWRDSLDSLITRCSFQINGELLDRVAEEIKKAGLTFNHQY